MNTELFNAVADGIEHEHRWDQASWFGNELMRKVREKMIKNGGKGIKPEKLINCNTGTFCVAGMAAVLGAPKGARIVVENDWDLYVVENYERHYLPNYAGELLDIPSWLSDRLFFSGTFEDSTASEAAAVLRKMGAADNEDEAWDILTPYAG